jgi:hypothetical protein
MNVHACHGRPPTGVCALQIFPMGRAADGSGETVGQTPAVGWILPPWQRNKMLQRDIPMETMAGGSENGEH